MFWRVAHDTLKWVGISFFPAIGFTVVAASGIAQAFPEAKPWLVQRYAEALAMMAQPPFWIAAAIVFIAWLAALIWSGYKVGTPAGGDTHIHHHYYAPLPDLTGPNLPEPKPEPKPARVPIQVHDSHHAHTSSEPKVVHDLIAQDVATGPAEVGTAIVRQLPGHPSVGLYVGMVIVSASRLAEENTLEIAIRAFNGTGDTIRIKAVEGAITSAEGSAADTLKLPPPVWKDEHKGNPIAAFSEFMIVLDQPLPPDTAKDFLRVFQESYVSLDMRGLDIVVEDSNAPEERIRLPIWDAISLRRRDDIFTGRIIMASMNVTLQPTTLIATGVVKDGKGE